MKLEKSCAHCGVTFTTIKPITRFCMKCAPFGWKLENPELLKQTLDRIFLRKIDKVSASPCWQWKGGTQRDGYGQIRRDKKAILAHRYSYEMFVGPIPAGLQIDHKCRNRRCVNPDHLEPVTQRENIMRGESVSAKNARKTHCKNGHALTPENVSIKTKGSRFSRRCKTCMAEKPKRRSLFMLPTEGSGA